MRQLAVELGGEIPTPEEAGYWQGHGSQDMREDKACPEKTPETAADEFWHPEMDGPYGPTHGHAYRSLSCFVLDTS